MARIFLSHSSANNAEAVALRDWLTAEGWDDLFLDLDPTRGIGAGERWELALNAAANRCEAVLFLVSRAWLSSRWCLKELSLARRLNKRIFGILVEDIPIGDLPADLTAAHQLVNLAAGSDHRMLAAKGPDGNEVRVTFSQSGLAKLKTGLTRAGLDARFFLWPPEDDPQRPPYRGLRPLEAEDAGIFFGREAPTIEVLDKLRGLAQAAPPRLLAIIGASGSGKSSFLRAGLAPRLVRDDRNFLILPIERPGRAALTGESGLVQALEAAAKTVGLARSRAAIKAAVQGGAADVAGLLAELADKAAVPDPDGSDVGQPPRVVLSVDQGEELFLAEGHEEAGAFLNLIRDLTSAPDSNLLVLLAIRSDAFERLQTAPALEGLNPQTYSLPPMPRGAYQTVIEGPAKRLADTDRVLTVEPALTEALMADIEDGGGKDALPLLAFTLERLYLEYGGGGALTLAHYRDLGRIRGSIEAAVEGALKAADGDPAVPKDRDARLALLRRALIPWLAGIDTETNAPRRRVARLSEIPPEARPLVDHLIEARLLSTDVARDTGERTVEPAHEALLRQWGLLQGWLEEDFAALSTLSGIQRAARDWAANNKDEAWLAHSAGRLEDAEVVAGRDDFAGMLEPTDRTYLAAAHAADTARRDRELEEARKLAEAQRKIARRTRMGLIAASILALLAIGAAAFGLQKAGEAARQTAIAEEKAGEAARETVIAEEKAAFAAQQTAIANKNLQEAEAARAETERQLARAQVNESRFFAAAGQRALADGNAELALGLASAALPEKPDEPKPDRPFVGEAEALLFQVRQVDRELAVLVGHQGGVISAVFSPDGTRVVTASYDRTARIWDAATGAELAVLKGHEDNVLSVVFSPDGTRLVTASADQTARIWDATTGAQLVVLKGHEDIVRSAAFSPDGTRVVTASDDKTARIWDPVTGAQLAVLKGHDFQVVSAAFSPDGTRVVTASYDKTARIWNVAMGAELVVLKGHDETVYSAAFSPDGTRVVTASVDKTARIWDAATGAELVALKGHDDIVESAAFSPDGTRVVTASDDKTARIWDPATGAVLAVLKGHGDWVKSAAFSPDGTRVVTAAVDKTARLWDVATGATLDVFVGHKNSVWSAVFSPDGTRVVTASDDATARIWNASIGAALAVLKGHEDNVWKAAFSPNGRQVVTASNDKTARLWDAATGAELAVLKGHGSFVNSAAFSPDGTRVATASGDHTARIWDAATGVELAVLKGHEDNVWTAAFSPDGTRVATASDDKTARIWATGTGAQLVVLKGHEDVVVLAAFSPDGTRVVTASNDATARIWNTATGAALAVLKGHKDNVSTAVFSPDGTKVVTASYDKTARIWDAASGATLAVLNGHEDIVNAAAFSPDGTKVVTASDDETVRLWDAATGAALAVLTGHQGHVMTAVFSPDGTRVVTASLDNTARLWDVATGDALAVLKGHDNFVTSAAFSPDGARVVTASDDKTARVWDVSKYYRIDGIYAARAEQLRDLTDAERASYGIEKTRPDAPGPPQAEVTDCDRLAAQPLDPARVAPGVLFAAITPEAIAACKAAVADAPNNPRLYFQLGRALEKAQQYPGAIGAYEQAAQSGYAFALSNLGNLYADGTGVDRDPAKAVDLWSKALEGGAFVAGSALGQAFWDGNGVEVDKSRAMTIWRSAAAMGDDYSHERLAWVAEFGRDGSAADLADALYHYAVAGRLLGGAGLDASYEIARRGTLARHLPIAVVANAWRRSLDFKASSNGGAK